MRISSCAAALALLVLGGACASPFKKIYPGMTASQVSEVMEKAPTRAELFEEEYAAWYYGEDRCILLHEGVVVVKQQTEETTTVHTPVGTFREELRAQCLPPGVVRPERRGREIDIRLPQGRIQGERQQQRQQTPEE